MATEIGRLTAVYEADVSNFEKGRKQVETGVKQTATSVGNSLDKLKADWNQKVNSMKTDLDSLSAKLKTVPVGPRQGPFAAVTGLKEKFQSTEKATVTSLNNIRTASVKTSQDAAAALGTLSPRLGAIAAAAGPLTATAAALVALGGAAVGIYKLATFAAQLGGEIHDLSQQVNFSAETLSGLKVAAELSGGSMESLSASLGIFDRNMEEAHDKSSEMSRIFKVLKIDIDDNEKALRQAFEALSKMPAGYQQTALSMKLFGRSGKDILGILKEADGDIDAFIEKMREMGLVITKDGARRADEFGDRLTMLQNLLAAVGRQIGSELMPVVQQAANDLSKWLTRNQGELQKTAKELADVVGWVYGLAKAASAISPILIEIRVIRKIVDVFKSGMPAGPDEGDVQFVRDFRSGGQNRMVFRNGQWEYQNERAAEMERQQSLRLFTPAKTAPRTSFGGGGSRGGGGSGRTGTDPGLQLLQQLQDEYKDLTGRTELQATWEKMLGQAYAKTSEEMKKKVYIQKADNIAMKEAIADMEKFVDLVRELGEKREAGFFRQRRAGGPSDLTDFFRDTGATRPRSAIAGLTRPRTVASGLTRPRIATDLEEATRRQYQEHFERMRGLAYDLTGLIETSVRDGFRGGLMSALDILRNVFLRQLEESLTQLFSKVTTGSGGRSFLGGLLNSLLGSIGFGFAGGGGATGGAGSALAGAFRASGGPVSAGRPYIVGERGPELFIPNLSGKIAANSSSTIINVNVPVRGGDSYASPRSRRRLAMDLASGIQGAMA